MIIYGTDLCPDCVQCKKDLTAASVSFEYRDISRDLKSFKEFLHLRDTEPVFAGVKEEGQIGIPAILSEDGRVCLSWDAYL